MSNLIQRVNLYPCPISMRNMTTNSESSGTKITVEDEVATITPNSAS